MFSFNDSQMIEFGRFTVYRTLKEMTDDGDDLNKIKFEELAESTLRNIESKHLTDIIGKIIKESNKNTQSTVISPFGEFVN